jgi:hypothetical protein
MKKMWLIFLMFPLVTNAAMDLDMRNQMLDSEIEKLTHQRDEKYEALQKCEQSTHGFKIAGITTLVATGVGVYGNIKLSQKLNSPTKGGGKSGNLQGSVTDSRSQKEKDCESVKELMAAGLATQTEVDETCN